MRSLPSIPDAGRRALATAAFACAAAAPASAMQDAQPVDWIPSLKSVAVVEPTGLDAFIVDRDAAIVLGKAFFWDVRLGSDGVACATCHHRAGADPRSRNTFHPGFDGFFEESIAPGGAAPADIFPTTLYADPASRFSARLRNIDDVAGSGGTRREFFDGLSAANEELCTESPAAPFITAGGDGVEQVTGRNAPSVVNAVFYSRLFLDGRANHWFNGVNPFGPVDADARVWSLEAGSKTPTQVAVLLDHSALASQAVGPVNNAVEMAAHGRGWIDVARKLLDSRPLALQEVSPTDGVLGPFADASGQGLDTTYRALIAQAFAPRWRSELPVADGTPQVEANMALLFGLAVQAYEATLVSDDSRYDRWMDAAGPLAGPAGHFDALEWRGLELFFNANPILPPTNCLNCHRTPLFSVATTLDEDAGAPEDGAGPLPQGVAIERMPSMAGTIESTALFVDDPAAPGADPAAQALDFEIDGARVEFGPLKGNAIIDVVMPELPQPLCGVSVKIDRTPFGPDGGRFRLDFIAANDCSRSLLVRARGFAPGIYEVRIDDVVRATFEMAGDDLYDAGFYNIGVRPTIEDLGAGGSHPNGVPLGVSDRLAAGLPIAEFDAPVPGYLGEAVRTRGAFKTPTLRNVELTAPYFHNGGVLTLEDTIRFYNRGGDFHEENLEDLHPDMEPLGLSEDDIAALAAFMRTLTDERVRDERPPFDHPSLPVANGFALPATGVLGRGEPCVLPVIDFDASLLLPDAGVDCDGNGRLDSCEIERDAGLDLDGDGMLDACLPPCPADIDGSLSVDGGDLTAILANWQSAGPETAALDLDGSGFVDGGDLSIILASWGPCPR